MREYVVNFLNDFDYPEEAKKELIEAYDILVSDDFCKGELDEIMKLYEADIKFDYGIIFKKTPEMEKKCGVHHYKSERIVFILLSKHLKALYKAEGIDESIWFNSMLDLKYKLFECKAVKNMWGSFVAWWFPGFFQLNRFALGRLQFETNAYDQADYTKDGKTVKKGDTVIGVHIPRTLTPLDKPSYDAAFDMAREFFKDKMNGAPMAFTCCSWLLYPDNIDILPEKSNVRKFMLEFDIINKFDDKPGEYADMWRLFDMDYTGNFDDYPEDSSLRRAFKAHLKNGGKTGEGYGIFFA